MARTDDGGDDLMTEPQGAQPFKVQVELWGRVFGSDNMVMLGTIDYTLADGDLVGRVDFAQSLDDFVKELNIEFASPRSPQMDAHNAG